MFHQRAAGTFQIEVGGEFHCGPDHSSPKIFGWSVEIDWDDEALNQNGFLLDNMMFRGYFMGLSYTTDSCELLVLKASKHFKGLAGNALKVTVGIDVPGLSTVTNTQP